MLEVLLKLLLIQLSCNLRINISRNIHTRRRIRRERSLNRLHINRGERRPRLLVNESRLSSIDSTRRRMAHSSSPSVFSRPIRRIALANDLLTRKPPSLAIFFREQRLLIPFGGLGGVGHVRVSFLQALHDAVHGFALRVALLVELGQRIVEDGLGVDEPAFEDCKVADLGTALFGFWVVASDFRVDAVRARRALGVRVSMQSLPLITVQCLQLAIALQTQSSAYYRIAR